MKKRVHILEINREVAEDYIKLITKKDILLTVEKWNETCEIMEDGCREVLNEVSQEILSEIQNNKFDFSRN